MAGKPTTRKQSKSSKSTSNTRKKPCCFSSSKFCSILDAIQTACPEDLAQIEQEIEDHEALVGELKKARQVITIAIGSMAPIDTNKSDRRNLLFKQRRRAVAKYILENGGTARRVDIARFSGVTENMGMYSIVRDYWFARNNHGHYYVTEIGKREYAKELAELKESERKRAA